MQGTVAVVGVLGGLLVGQILAFRYLNGTLPSLGQSAGASDAFAGGESGHGHSDTLSGGLEAGTESTDTVRCGRCGAVNEAEQSFTRCFECCALLK